MGPLYFLWNRYSQALNWVHYALLILLTYFNSQGGKPAISVLYVRSDTRSTGVH